MLILTIRTDKPEAEIGLFEDRAQLHYISWQAHRELSDTIHLKIREILKSSNKNLNDINGILAYQGPGSFTGLRIGISVANALAYSLGIPISSSTGQAWINEGFEKFNKHSREKQVFPNYGSEVHVTKPKK